MVDGARIIRNHLFQFSSPLSLFLFLRYTVILNARNAMTGMAHHINDMKRRHEHCVRVQEIQSLLYGWPVSAAANLRQQKTITKIYVWV